ncbi:hypothetical protein CYLTODRAFT_492902 [Cylindrobasidium torrendii FP15055 ss-10]|uniref:Transmembrane protein n=1 Tax=Cylindrobasidium torrendii FP15055 ss-10 TaxID=1314674 RepID=A0A0D7B5D0_9AGAR|nr:hypothetical protein CYLTODRAFT_492902 [Cylindrobasidium torrendii FP15055 ss-10]
MQLQGQFRRFSERFNLSYVTTAYVLFCVAHCAVQVTIHVADARSDMAGTVRPLGHGMPTHPDDHANHIAPVAAASPANLLDDVVFPVELKREEEVIQKRSVPLLLRPEHQRPGLVPSEILPLAEFKQLNRERESRVLIAFQCYLLALSLFGVFQKSISTIIASGIAHTLATAWSAVHVVNTTKILGSVAGHGVSRSAIFWAERASVAWAALFFGLPSTVLFIMMSWKVIRSFSRDTLDKMHVSRDMARMFWTAVAFAVALELSAFTIGANAYLWLHTIFNTHSLVDAAMHCFARIIVGLILVAWMLFGWHGVRYESLAHSIIFLALSFGYMVGWTSFFHSPVFLSNLDYWPFFRVITTASAALNILAFAIGAAAVDNFGRGLLQEEDEEEEESAIRVILFDAEDSEKARLIDVEEC